MANENETYLGLNLDYIRECSEKAMKTPVYPMSAEQMRAQTERNHQLVMEEYMKESNAKSQI